jgi:hypothetical protein
MYEVFYRTAGGRAEQLLGRYPTEDLAYQARDALWDRPGMEQVRVVGGGPVVECAGFGAGAEGVLEIADGPAEGAA